MCYFMRVGVNREWMYERLEGNFLSPTFANKVDEFITYATTQDNVVIDRMMKCPCAKCRNIPYEDLETVKVQLYRFGFTPNYYRWVFHGENSASTSTERTSNPYRSMVLDAFRQESDLEDIEEEPLPSHKKFFDMLKAAEEPLYDGCKLSLLSAAARMANIKCEYNIPRRAIDGFASLMKDMCPDENKMAESFYKTKTLLKGGRYKTFRNNDNNSPHSVLTYFPICPRLQRLYATKSTVEQMRWHKDNPRDNRLMSHPSDGEAWKHLDKEYESFAAEFRNVRLGLCTDGFSPFGKTGKQYSCWPVILTPYNLPPGLCMKKPFMFLSLIISGPKSPKGNPDVFLQPLIEELKLLWEIGLPTYDISNKQNFQMKVALHTACSQDGPRRFLSHNHVFRKNKSAFRKDTVENSSPPPRLSGEEVWNRVSLLPKTTECIRNEGKRPEWYGILHHWTKQSVFWELPYWRKLLIHHNLDVMHIEKNVFDNVFHTIMDVKGKTKDDLKMSSNIGNPGKSVQEVEQEDDDVRSARFSIRK
ncbi:uncharacterized protein LOC130591880 [Beta vulgaris subsp. vulgaris]|uniref:uncharacterized protein LOC130591880 n=1 Tax=Beta vulgaris subsp. vulgaris TaxID=3555 RepID=UPI0025492A74|nr:uncharacterized protein LOC130591880 [Beta vulgaris subsp. vulgaris]